MKKRHEDVSFFFNFDSSSRPRRRLLVVFNIIFEFYAEFQLELQVEFSPIEPNPSNHPEQDERFYSETPKVF